MEDITNFKNKIFIFGICIMVAIELVSLPFHGFDWKFLCGLSLGTAIAIANFNIMTISTIMMFNKGSLKGRAKLLPLMSLLIRLLLYGGIFYLSMRLSTAAGIASVCGFMTLKIAIYVIYVIIPFVKKDDSKRNDVIKIKKQTLVVAPQWIRYVKGRKVMTFRKFVEYRH